MKCEPEWSVRYAKYASQVIYLSLFLPGMAALHEAVLSGNLECVKLLIKYGADVHQRDEDGWTPLHMACSDGYPEIARYSCKCTDKQHNNIKLLRDGKGTSE